MVEKYNPAEQRSDDHIDRLRNQWNNVRPDINTRPMDIVGRINRLALMFGEPITKQMQSYGIERGEFDVLATLRRSGRPYELSPTQLYQDLMLSSGGITNRIKRLSDKGLVTRRPNPDDGRSDLVCLTQKGIALADEVFQADMVIEADLIGKLEETDKCLLAGLLKQLCHSVESDREPNSLE